MHGRPEPAPGGARPPITQVTQTKDNLFARPRDPGEPFRFDATVAPVFPDMISRSVPGYGELVRLTALVGKHFLKPGTRCYDLGCSLGAVSLALREAAARQGCELIAVDNSPAMIGTLAACLGPDRGPMRPVCADLASVRVREASVVVLNLTLQFVPPGQRLEVLGEIRRGLLPGGALILSEKVRLEDATEAKLFAVLHEDFKRANGYSELEISQKRAALERVLIPDSLETHAARLEAAGFAGSLCWFRCLSFVSLLAWT